MLESSTVKGVSPHERSARSCRAKRQVLEALEDALNFSARVYEALSDTRIGVSSIGVATCQAAQEPLDRLVQETKKLRTGIRAVVQILKAEEAS